MNSLANLYAVFRTLQPELRAWLTSDEVMAAIETIARAFILSKSQERQMPILILRLVTQDIPPESFKAALAERLGVSPDIAAHVAEKMREGILSPVEQVLRFNGVDVGAIGLDAPVTPSPVPAPMPAAPAPLPVTPQPNPIAPPASPNQIDPLPAAAPMQPFILHAEPKAAAPEPIKPSFSFTPPSPTGSGGQRAPKVIIERVVHYGALITPLNQTSRAPLKRVS